MFVESRTRVRYKDTDQMGIAHHSNYIVWFEIGRTDLCRETGVPYSEIERRGHILVVAEVRCRYLIPYRYDDEVVVRTSVAELGSRIIEFHYLLMDSASSVQHATGSSRHVWVSRESRRPAAADPGLIALFQPYAEARAL